MSVMVLPVFFGSIQVQGDEPDNETKRPNIIVLMADDLGFSDLGCYGGEIETPNLDQLAARGVRFSQFYNASRCCPTRASLLTGKYAHEVGLQFNGQNLSNQVPTIAEILKTAGYNTAMLGKWHLSEAIPYDDGGFNSENHLRWLNRDPSLPAKPFAELATYPAARGFDSHFGIIWGVADYFHPFSLVEDFSSVKDLPEDFYLTDAINNRSAEVIRDLTRSDAPFFLYIAHTAPHWPLHAREEELKKYRGRYDEGWTALREERYQRQIDMGVVNPDVVLPELNRGTDSNWGLQPEWDTLSADRKVLEARRMEAHAAMIDRMDQGLAEVFEALKETGAWDHTIILFLSDNGTSPEQVRRSGYDRPSKTRDGQLIQYENELEIECIGSERAFAGIGPAWANAANTPFRYWKKESYEGGNHTPVILFWSKLQDEVAGSFVDGTHHVIDVLPTVLAASGVTYPDAFRQHPLSGLEGISIVEEDGSFRDVEDSENRVLYFEHEGGAALWSRDWKIVRLKDAPWHLYDISKDPTETTDLTAKFPDKRDELVGVWEAWFERVTAKAE